MKDTFHQLAAILTVTLYSLLLIISTLCSCGKINQTPPDDDPTKRPIEPALGKSVLNAVVDSMQFGTFFEGNFAWLYIRDVDNDSLLRIEVNWHLDAVTVKVDSENLVGKTALINWDSEFQTSDSVFLELHNPNQRQITFDVDSSWENVYMLGVEHVKATITPKTRIFYTTDNNFQSQQLLRTDTAGRRLAQEAINSTFLNIFGQPQIDSYLGNHILSYSPCWVYILRPKDW